MTITGLFIPSRIVGLLARALGIAAIFAYTSTGSGESLPVNAMALLKLPVFAFVGVVWWVVGRIMRWAFCKVARAGS